MSTIFENDNYVNIFTDGSIYKNGQTGETITCPGAILVRNNTIDNNIKILRNSTNNEAEITAILLGVDMAINFRNNNLGQRFIFNIFSDSKISVYGLREWIFKWYKSCDNGTMISSSGKPVANQEIFKNIVLKVISSNIPINLYHQKGHVCITSDKSLKNALAVFNESNYMDIDDLAFIKTISMYNDKIDLDTKDVLNDYIKNNDISNTTDVYPHAIINNIEDSKLISKYKNMINFKER